MDTRELEDIHGLSFVKGEEPWNPDRARIVNGSLVCGNEIAVNTVQLKIPTQETALAHLKLFFGIKGRSKKKDDDEDEPKPETKKKDLSDDESEDESEEESEDESYSEDELGGDSDS